MPECSAEERAVLDAQRYFDTLKKIARDYMTPAQCARHAASYGCSPEEMIEMTFENIQHEAKIAIKGRRRPSLSRPAAGSEDDRKERGT